MSDFKTNKNKALLWNLMMETNVFAGVPEENYEKVKYLFETEIDTVSKNTKLNDLTEMNKYVLLEVTKKLNPLRIKEKSISETAVITNAVITNADIKEKRYNEFVETLTDKQKDFSDLITIHKPNEIDFADSQDTPFEGNIDDVLEKMMKQRESDIKGVMSKHTPEVANKWINNEIKPPSLIIKETVDTPEKETVDTPEKETQPSLIIKETVDTSEKEKHTVRFVDTNYTYNNNETDLLEFLSKSTVNPINLLRDMKQMHMDCLEKIELCIKQLETDN